VRTFLQKGYRASCLALENLARFIPLPKDKIRVHHGADPWGIGGPVVKIQRMQKHFPDHPLRYNIIYTVSARVPSGVCIHAKKRGVKIVQHINSIYNAIYRPNYEQMNRPFKEIYEMADHVVFGSLHAKESSEKFFGKCTAPSSIIYNSIDMSHFTFQKRPENRFNVMVIGHYIRHRIEPLIRAMPHLTKKIPKAKLIIAGPLREGKGVFDCSKESFEKLARELRVDNIEYIPRFTQEQAPSIYALGDIMVHIMHMDWTPNTVIESMACGLPVLHSGNGGLPEIVGGGGLSLDMPYDWHNIHSADPEMLADKIIELYEIRKEKAEMARNFAEERYDLNNWIHQHKQIFEGLFNGHA
jgi:glycosyltransferase involved in cell wall biosynthesis